MKGWKTAGFTAGLLIISMFFSGCTQAADGNVMDGGDYILNDREGAVTEKDLAEDALTQIMGHWRDEAGSKELWITEDTVTVKQGEYSKEYGYVLEEEDGRPRIASTEGYGYFGGMTKPVLREDGTLYAEEMLDDDSLVYRFVKTED